MPTEPLPFVNALQSGDEELGGASPQALNITVDGAGAVRRRPGIVPYLATGQPSFEAAQAIHVTEDGQVFAVLPRSPSSSVIYDVYRFAPGGYVHIGDMVAVTRPVIAETEMLLVLAGGLSIRKVELQSATAVTDLGGSPPNATHVARNSLRLLANDRTVDRTKIRYSSQAQGTTTYAGHEEWSVGEGTAGFFTAEAAPDPIVALAENTNEVWAFGSKTLQIFAADPTQIFAPTVTMEVGCCAPYSVVKKEGEFYWLDHMRRFVRSSGRGTEVLSLGLRRVLQDFGRVDDCYGYRVQVGPVDGVVWTFPTVGRTFFVQDGAGWSEWTQWSGATSQHTPFRVASLGYHQDTSQNLVGVPELGVGVLQRTYPYDTINTDLEGEPIVAEVTTGFLNRGTDARKICKSIRLTFRRGSTSARTEIRGYIRYRDSLGTWEPAIPVVLDGAQPVYEITSLGSYRRRQWKYSFSDAAEELVLAGAEEEFEVVA